MDIVNSLKLLCRHGEVTNLSTGSIRFTVRCTSVHTCQALWEDYKSGVLLKAFQRSFVRHKLLIACGASAITLRVRIAESDYLQCLLELGKSCISTHKV